MKYEGLKNAGAILAGFVIILLLTSTTDMILESTGIFPTVEEQKKYGFNVLWMNLLALVYRFTYGIVGGFITSKLSVKKPMKNVTILGLIGTILALIGNIAVSQMPEMKGVLPLWFSIVLVLTAFPSVWLGGKIQQKYR